MTAVYLLLFTLEQMCFEDEKALESSGKAAAALQVFVGNKRLYAFVTKCSFCWAHGDVDRARSVQLLQQLVTSGYWSSWHQSRNFLIHHTTSKSSGKRVV